jgi:carboxyl-terminal processing protease
MACVAIITFFITTNLSLKKFNKNISNIRATAARFADFDEVYKLVKDNFYIDSDTRNSVSNGISGYIAGLNDKYSVYYTQKQLEEANDAMKSSLTGIGVSVKEENGYIKIIEVLTDTLAQEALKVGDVIVKVAGVDVKDTGYKEALNQIRVGLYDGIEMTVRRNGLDEVRKFTNRTLENTSLVTGETISGDVYYIKINHFDNGSFEQFKEVFAKCNTPKLIIDVRNNTGGLISECEKMLALLLPKGEFAKATYRDGREETIVKSENNLAFTGNIILLVNGTTASSAELFTATLKDEAMATTIGVRTFGKGIMQQTFMPKSGGSLTLTVATIRTNKNPSWHGIGLLPDVEVALSSDLGINLGADVVEEDKQLNKALEIYKNS